MINYIDTHAHIYEEYYSDIPDLIKFIKDMGITRVINAGCDLKSSLEVLELADKYDILSCAIGIHPESASNYQDSDLRIIEDNLKNKNVVAIDTFDHYLEISSIQRRTKRSKLNYSKSNLDLLKNIICQW